MIIDLYQLPLLRRVQSADTALFSWVMARPRFDRWAMLSRWLSRSADGFLYPLIGVLLYWQGSGLVAAAIALAFAIERPLYWLLKNSCRRFRPPDCLPGVTSVVVPSDRFSFPSGHTSGAFLVATAVAVAAPVLQLPVLIWAGSIGWSRVCLGVHFPTDTLVGALLGVSCAQLALGFVGGLPS